jgi:hypothetical protein
MESAVVTKHNYVSTIMYLLLCIYLILYYVSTLYICIMYLPYKVEAYNARLEHNMLWDVCNHCMVRARSERCHSLDTRSRVTLLHCCFELDRLQQHVRK